MEMRRRVKNLDGVGRGSAGFPVAAQHLATIDVVIVSLVNR